MGNVLQTRRGFLRRLLAIMLPVGIVDPALVFADGLVSSLQKIKGKVIRCTDKDYLSWWAGMSWYMYKPNRYPDIIIQALSLGDVIAAINHARENKLKIAVRSSGHNQAKSVLRQGGMLLDLSQLCSVEIDPIARTAWIGPGIRSEELQQLTLQHGLVFPGAHSGLVGLGGYLLGGGIGWNIPELGIACRSVLAAETVTADGKTHIASTNSDRELLWAIRGCGPGFFGAVTRYKLQLYPAHNYLVLNKYLVPTEKMEDAVIALEKISQQMSSRLEVLIKVGRFFPADKSYKDRSLVCTIAFFAFADSQQDAQEILTPVINSRIGEISLSTQKNVPISYEHLYVPTETDFSSPQRSTTENCWTDDPGRCLLLLSEKMEKQPPPSPRSFIITGWGFNKTFRDEDSCIKSDAPHCVSCYLVADEEAHIEPNYTWMDESVELLKPLSKGRYINEIDIVRYPRHIRECFSPDSWGKLAQLRKKYDPDGVFHSYLYQS